MAIMVDKKPEYKGEALVWESLSMNLPNDVVVYNTREIVDDREFDFALLIKGLGILVIEVKGWEAKYIYEVSNVDTIIMVNDSKIYHSPEKQARSYRFDWLNYLDNEFSVHPLVFSMVCYPFITEQEFYEKGLDIVSKSEFTLFAEDMKSPNKLSKKIINLFSKKKGLSSDDMDDRLITLIRKKLEPQFNNNSIPKEKIENPYSVLKIFKGHISNSDIDILIDDYFEGVKTVCFFKSREDLENVTYRLNKELNQRSVYADKKNLKALGISENNNITISKNSVNIFNFEAYIHTLSLEEDIVVYEGEMSDKEKAMLKTLSENTAFNFNQFLVEHASTNKNVLVRAGAGTGKTYSMVSRIAFLCGNRDNAISSIVDELAMVTFTNDAADNMKKRLKQAFINYFLLTRKRRYLHNIELVDQMQISTIHKFAKKLLQDVSIEYGLSSNFSIAKTEYKRSQIYDKYLNEYISKKQIEDPNFSVQLKMPTYEFKNKIMNFSNQLFDKSSDIRDISPESYGYFEAMPFFNEVIEDVIVKAEKELSEYSIDNNKVELKELMILLSDAVSKQKINSRNLNYKYLFIDEFQDTDDIQIELFNKLSANIKHLKLFVVGDIKQSIYRFRGADGTAFDRLKVDEKWKVYTLNINYRTDVRLLNFYNEMFTKIGKLNYLSFDKDQDSLTSHILIDTPANEFVRVIPYSARHEKIYDKLFDEIAFQKNQIDILSKKQKLSSSEKTVAILVRENWQIEEIVSEAKKRHIFIETDVGGDLYQLTPSLDLYKLVLALCNSKNTRYLYNLLTSNYVTSAYTIHHLHGEDEIKKQEFMVSLLDEYFLKCMGITWSQLLKDLKTKPVLRVLRDIYMATKPWAKHSDSLNEQNFYKTNYELLLENIIRQNSVDYLTLNVLEKSLGINILTQQKAMARNPISDNDICVICTTIHKSKGLEYGTVILPYTDVDIGSLKKADMDVVYMNGKLSFGMRVGKGINKKYNSNYNTKEEESQRKNEETRVLYVALTRAIRNLVWFKNVDEKKHVSWQSLMEG